MGIIKHAQLSLVLGMALFWAMLRPPYMNAVFGPYNGQIPVSRLPFDFVVLLFAVLVLLLARQFSWSVSRRAILSAAASCCCVFGTLLIATRAFESQAIALAGSALFAVGLVQSMLTWVLCLESSNTRGSSTVVLLSFLVSLAFGLLDPLGESSFSVLVVVFPAAQFFLSMFANVASHVRLDEQPESGVDETARAEGAISQADRSCPYLKLAIFLVCIEIFACALLRGAWTHGGIGYSYSPKSIMTYVLSAFLAAVSLCVYQRTTKSGLGALLMAGMGALAILASAFLLAFAHTQPAASLLTALHSVLLAVLLASLISLARRSMREVSQRYAAYGALFMAVGSTSQIVTYHLTALVLPANVSPGPDSLTTASLACVLLLSLGVIAGMCVLLVSRLKRLSRPQAGGRADGAPSIPAQAPLESKTDAGVGEGPFDEGIMQTVPFYQDLTQREREIALLLGRGFTVKRTAEELCLAPSTVQGYSKTIYRKLGIHRKQELIDLLNRP